MNVELLERLVKLMASNDLNTVDLRDGDQRVVLKRGTPAPANVGSQPQALYAPASNPPPAHGSAYAGAAHSAEVPTERQLAAIKSPMVGTFYSSSSPDAPPFVSVGSEVDEETDVCIIEAMKVFNNIKAECRGTIEQVLVTNGQTVEFGQVLFLVKPA